MFRNEMYNRHGSCYSKHIRFFTEQRYIKYPLAELKCSYNDIQKVAHIVDF